ncbi:MAG: IS66 family transposase, partial [Pseudomonadota bacterium]
MDLDLSQLPPAYRAAFEAQRAQIAVLSEANARLELLVAEFRQVVRGKKSEKLSPDERQLSFEDLEAAVAEVEAVKADAT